MRAKHPKPYQIVVGLSRQGWKEKPGKSSIGYDVVSRMYDRRTGNFKAIGWLIRVSYIEFDEERNSVDGEIVVPLLDEFMPNYVQTTL